MNDKALDGAHHALHGELAGMLNAAWRRSALAATAPRDAAEASRQCRRRRAARLKLVAVPGLALAVSILGVLPTVDGAVIAAPAHGEAARAGSALTASRRDAAVQALRAGRHADAFGRFAGLADEGDAASAGMALVMVCNGLALFGSDWSATPGQLQRWNALAEQGLHDRGIGLADHDRGE